MGRGKNKNKKKVATNVLAQFMHTGNDDAVQHMLNYKRLDRSIKELRNESSMQKIIETIIKYPLDVALEHARNVADDRDMSAKQREAFLHQVEVAKAAVDDYKECDASLGEPSPQPITFSLIESSSKALFSHALTFDRSLHDMALEISRMLDKVDDLLQSNNDSFQELKVSRATLISLFQYWAQQFNPLIQCCLSAIREKDRTAEKLSIENLRLKEQLRQASARGRNSGQASIRSSGDGNASGAVVDADSGTATISGHGFIVPDEDGALLKPFHTDNIVDDISSETTFEAYEIRKNIDRVQDERHAGLSDRLKKSADPLSALADQLMSESAEMSFEYQNGVAVDLETRVEIVTKDLGLFEAELRKAVLESSTGNIALEAFNRLPADEKTLDGLKDAIQTVNEPKWKQFFSKEPNMNKVIIRNVDFKAVSPLKLKLALLRFGKISWVHDDLLKKIFCVEFERLRDLKAAIAANPLETHGQILYLKLVKDYYGIKQLEDIKADEMAKAKDQAGPSTSKARKDTTYREALLVEESGKVVDFKVMKSVLEKFGRILDFETCSEAPMFCTVTYSTQKQRDDAVAYSPFKVKGHTFCLVSSDVKGMEVEKLIGSYLASKEKDGTAHPDSPCPAATGSAANARKDSAASSGLSKGAESIKATKGVIFDVKKIENHFPELEETLRSYGRLLVFRPAMQFDMIAIHFASSNALEAAAADSPFQINGHAVVLHPITDEEFINNSDGILSRAEEASGRQSGASVAASRSLHKSAGSTAGDSSTSAMTENQPDIYGGRRAVFGDVNLNKNQCAALHKLLQKYGRVSSFKVIRPMSMIMVRYNTPDDLHAATAASPYNIDDHTLVPIAITDKEYARIKKGTPVSRLTDRTPSAAHSAAPSPNVTSKEPLPATPTPKKAAAKTSSAPDSPRVASDYPPPAPPTPARAAARTPLAPASPATVVEAIPSASSSPSKLAEAAETTKAVISNINWQTTDGALLRRSLEMCGEIVRFDKKPNSVSFEFSNSMGLQTAVFVNPHRVSGHDFDVDPRITTKKKKGRRGGTSSEAPVAPSFRPVVPKLSLEDAKVAVKAVNSPYTKSALSNTKGFRAFMYVVDFQYVHVAILKSNLQKFGELLSFVASWDHKMIVVKFATEDAREAALNGNPHRINGRHLKLELEDTQVSESPSEEESSDAASDGTVTERRKTYRESSGTKLPEVETTTEGNDDPRSMPGAWPQDTEGVINDVDYSTVTLERLAPALKRYGALKKLEWRRTENSVCICILYAHPGGLRAAIAANPLRVDGHVLTVRYKYQSQAPARPDDRFKEISEDLARKLTDSFTESIAREGCTASNMPREEACLTPAPTKGFIRCQPQDGDLSESRDLVRLSLEPFGKVVYVASNLEGTSFFVEFEDAAALRTAASSIPFRVKGQDMIVRIAGENEHAGNQNGIDNDSASLPQEAFRLSFLCSDWKAYRDLDIAELGRTLEQYGETLFYSSDDRQDPFTVYASKESADAAVAASPHTVAGIEVVVEYPKSKGPPGVESASSSPKASPALDAKAYAAMVSGSAAATDKGPLNKGVHHHAATIVAAMQKFPFLSFIRSADPTKVQLSEIYPAFRQFGEINVLTRCAAEDPNAVWINYATKSGYEAAVAANPHIVNGEELIIEARNLVFKRMLAGSGGQTLSIPNSIKGTIEELKDYYVQLAAEGVLTIPKAVTESGESVDLSSEFEVIGEMMGTRILYETVKEKLIENGVEPTHAQVVNIVQEAKKLGLHNLTKEQFLAHDPTLYTELLRDRYIELLGNASNEGQSPSIQVFRFTSPTGETAVVNVEFQLGTGGIIEGMQPALPSVAGSLAAASTAAPAARVPMIEPFPPPSPTKRRKLEHTPASTSSSAKTTAKGKGKEPASPQASSSAAAGQAAKSPAGTTGKSKTDQAMSAILGTISRLDTFKNTRITNINFIHSDMYPDGDYGLLGVKMKITHWTDKGSKLFNIDVRRHVSGSKTNAMEAVFDGTTKKSDEVFLSKAEMEAEPAAIEALEPEPEPGAWASASGSVSKKGKGKAKANTLGKSKGKNAKAEIPGLDRKTERGEKALDLRNLPSKVKERMGEMAREVLSMHAEQVESEMAGQSMPGTYEEW